ncbi:sodium channel protein Nach-like [Venturia canescens]|uniref:sodium channel protein Nach-like n=1 Tax=Venturia canescens TaxID=32260 RepID=UPI001C9D5437|nr:sodium channel protein Nach-like [Venturia canescens]
MFQRGFCHTPAGGRRQGEWTITVKPWKKRAKSGVKRGWINAASRRSHGWRFFVQIFGKNWRDYCDNSSLVGFQYLVEPHRSRIERAIWIILQAMTFSMLGFLVHDAYMEYIDVPVVTVVDSDNYPSDQLEFPGIAICNINRISRKAAVEFVHEIMDSFATNMTFSEVLNLVRQLGSLYDSTVRANTTAEKQLDQLLMGYFNGGYDVTGIMRRLSPNCIDGFLYCGFHGSPRNCSEIFVFRKTQDGFCCTFNYARESDDLSSSIDDAKAAIPLKPHFIKKLGLNSGLTLLMEPSLDDYFYPTLPVVGWKLTVFNAYDYPDDASGSVSEALLTPATESYVQLEVSSFYSTAAIRSVSADKRKCLFQDELPVMYAGYTYSDCLVDCRAAVTWDTCKCRPFYLPRRGNDQYSRKVCSAMDSECLGSYKEIYSSVLSHKVEAQSKTESAYTMNPETAKLCGNCYPACNDVRYYIHTSEAYFEGDEFYDERTMESLHLRNRSFIHIYFSKLGSVRLRQEAAYYWYELLSNIGGICGSFIGFSLISVVEFLYFTLCMIHEFCRGKRETMTMENTARTAEGTTCTKWRKRGNAKHLAGTLYWNEFLPHGIVTVQNGKVHRLQLRKY